MYSGCIISTIISQLIVHVNVVSTYVVNTNLRVNHLIITDVLNKLVHLQIFNLYCKYFWFIEKYWNMIIYLYFMKISDYNKFNIIFTLCIFFLSHTFSYLLSSSLAKW